MEPCSLFFRLFSMLSKYGMKALIWQLKQLPETASCSLWLLE